MKRRSHKTHGSKDANFSSPCKWQPIWKSWHLSPMTLYRILLLLYPAPFRNEYATELTQLFEDLYPETGLSQQHNGKVRFWVTILQDLLLTVPKEHLAIWRHDMRLFEKATIIIGSLFLAFTSSFILINVLKYEFGINILWNPFEALFADRTDFGRFVLDMLILLSPIMAITLFFLPSVRISFGKNGTLTTVSIQKINRISLILIATCLIALTVLFTYVIAENLPCLLGQQLSC